MQRLRTSVITLVSLVFGLIGTQIIQIPDLASASGPIAPVTINGADQETTMLIRRAVARYTEAGLELPNLEFFVATDEDRAPCEGHVGLWRRGDRADRIDLCVVSQWLILHEIAHAWENRAVDDTTRTAFMALYPENEWEDESVAHRDQVIERFADVVAWGFMFRDIPAGKVDALQPRIAEFELITGVAPPRLTDIAA